MTSARRIVKNIFSLATAELISKGVSIITVAYLARVIDPRGFGIIGFATAFISFFSLLINLGFDTVGTREIARDKDKIRKYVNGIITIRVIMAIFGYIAFAVIVSLLDKPALVKNVLFLTGLGLFANAFLLNWVFQGIEKMGVIALRQILTSLLNLLGVLLLVHNNEDLLWAVSVTVLSNVINTIWMGAVYVKHFGKIKFEFDLPLWKDMFRSALPLAFSSFMIAVYYNMDMVMLGFMRNEIEVGYYSAAYRILILTLIPSGIILSSFFPQLSIANGNKNRTILLMRKYSAAMFIISGFISFTGIAFASNIINAVFGKEFYQSVGLLQILMVNTLIVYINTTYGNPLLAWDKERPYTFAIATGAISNIILNFLLIPGYGALGAAIATVASEAVVLVGLAFFHYRSLQTLYLNSLVKVLFIVVASMGIANLIQNSGISMIISFIFTSLIFISFNLILRTVNLKELKEYLT